MYCVTYGFIKLLWLRLNYQGESAIDINIFEITVLWNWVNGGSLLSLQITCLAAIVARNNNNYDNQLMVMGLNLNFIAEIWQMRMLLLQQKRNFNDLKLSKWKTNTILLHSWTSINEMVLR